MRSLTSLTLLVTVAALSFGCANPTLDSEAEQLRSELADLPGVTSAALDYSEPVTLDSGKLALAVEMSDSATPDEVVTVAETAYRAFSSTHDGEEADLAIRAGASAVTLRSYEPDASVAAVGEAVRTGFAATPEDASVAIELTTQDVAKGDHVAGSYLVALPQGSTFADVPDLLGSLDTGQSDTSLFGWGGAAADGSSLTYEKGLPSEELIDRWRQMQSPEAPLSVRAFEDGALLTEARLTKRFDVDDPAQRRALDSITHPQLLALGDGEWSYALLGPRGSYLADIDRYICAPGSEGAYDDQLEAWVTEQFGPCQAE
ncbi:hypothetical protein [Nocardioides pacificus]